MKTPDPFKGPLVKTNPDALRILVALAVNVRRSMYSLKRYQADFQRYCVKIGNKKIDQKDNELGLEVAGHFQDMAQHRFDSNKFDLNLAKIAVGRFGKIRFSELPSAEYGDIMPLKKWIKNCNAGGFIDYDGHGELATVDKCSNISIWPSIRHTMKYPDWATHIVWYNK